MQSKIVEYLFETGAVKVAEAGKVFLFTSGLISPYYVSTHFLCGGEKASTNMLEVIDSFKASPASIVTEVSKKIEDLVSGNRIYEDVINLMLDVARKSKYFQEIDCVSGGERRDWFFSVPLASRLNLPHVYLYNDGLVLDDNASAMSSSKNSKSLHVADLLTVGSSYTSKWMPYLRKVGVDISTSLNCVDRDQGGVDNLITGGVCEVLSLCKINEDFFKLALSSKVIDQGQYQQLLSFYQDQYNTMRDYLINNPVFIQDSLDSDEKTKKRILLTLQNDLYKLGDEFISQFKI